MSSDTSDDLAITNPERQAIDPMRGFDYQIWQSLKRWVSLRKGEVLFLEGGEDLDVVRGSNAETIQVTALARPVTLNTQKVLAAIANFWRHQENNPDYTVTFRFLTTAERGLERDKPFGSVSGLDYWDKCRRVDVDVAPLRQFLSNKEKLPVEMRAYVADASDEELRDRLINRIEWDTGQKPKPYIKELVTDHVVDYGTHALLLSYSEAVKTIPHLFDHVWSVILQPDNRRLTYADFTALLENLTRVSVPRRLLQAKAVGYEALGSLMMGKAAFSVDLGDKVAPQFYGASIQDLASRETLLKEIQQQLQRNGLLVLHASSGMGKSTLANIVASQDTSEWRLLDFRDLNPDSINEQLRYAALKDTAESLDCGYIVDDINFNAGVAMYERTLAGFIHTVTSRGGRLMITTQGELPELVRAAFDVDPNAVINVPEFTEEEIGDLAAKNGCPVEKLKSWQRVIWGNTLGHPQLVHARVKNIARAGWPDPNPNDLFKPNGIEQVRAQARRRLHEQLPSESARALVYRLSVLTGYFKRNHVLHLATHPPEILNAGESLDLLIGPWVERMKNGYHRLSPLLANSLEEMYTAAQIKDLHKTAAYAYLTQPTLTPTEANGALLHGLLGEISEPLMVVAAAAQKLDAGGWRVIARELDWFTMLALEPGTRLLKFDPITSLMLRQVQFKIAVQLSAPEKVTSIVEAWESELLRLDEFRARPFYLASKMVAQLLFNQILFHLEIALPLEQVVRNIGRAIAVELESQAAAAAGDQQMAALLRERPADVAALDTEIQFAIARCEDAADINKVLDTLDTLDKTVVEVFWRELDNKAYVAMNFVSSSWVGELKKSSPDWNRSLAVLERIAVSALAHKAGAVFAHAEVAKAILVREYLPDHESTLAEQILTEAAERLGHAHPALQDYRAKLYLLDKKYEEALEEWQNTPPPHETEDINTRLFMHREAIVCAARLGRWEMAAEFASQGLEAAHRLSYVDDTTAVGFIAERAFALWKAGQPEESLAVFVGLLDSLAALPDTNSHIRSYTLHVAIVNALRWLEQNPEYGANQIEPQPGDFTLQTVDEAFRTTPIPSYASYWFHLARLEYKWTNGNSILRCFEAEAAKLGTPEITFQLEHLHVLHSLRNPTLESLVEVGARFADSVQGFTTVLPSKPSAVPQSQIIITLLFAGLVTLCGRNAISSIPVARWRSHATTAGLLDENLASWLDLLERCIGASQEELLEILTDLQQSVDARATAALFLSCERDIDIERFFFANSVLLNAVHAYSFWRPATESFVETIMSNGWMEVVANQRFAIRASVRSIPQITAACQDASASGLKKAAQILLAAQNAVSYSLPTELLAKLSSLSNE